LPREVTMCDSAGLLGQIDAAGRLAPVIAANLL
jgi:hypothetical protein